MKPIIKTILILSLTISSYAQSNLDINNLTPFVGNWEWVNGNQTFKVEIFIEDNYLKGHYKLVETNNGVENEIYKSNIPMGGDQGWLFGPVIFGGSYDGILFGANIKDNVLYAEGTHNTKDGDLEFIIQDSCATCPITATWKISKTLGMRSTKTPENFTIPIDIILTKVN